MAARFWASLIKVIALGYVSDRQFLVFLAGRYKIDGQETGGLPVEQPWRHRANRSAAHIVLVTSGVVFAYAAIELVGIAAGKQPNRQRSCRAINSVVLRIACFVRSTVLLTLLLLYRLQDMSAVRDLLFQDRYRRGGQRR